MAASSPQDDLPIDAAINWMVELSSGTTSDRQRRAFKRWLGEDPRHEQAWHRLQDGLLPCGVAARQDLPRGALTDRLTGRRMDRRSVVASIASVLGVGMAGALTADRFLPLSDILADHVTRTGQESRVRLDDGSEIVLAPRTAVDVDFTAGQRKVRLIQGEILLHVAAGSGSFRFEAGALSLEAELGRFMVERRSEILAATGVDGSARITFDIAAPMSLGREERVTLENGRLLRETVDSDDATAWLEGLLIAKNRTVASIVRALRPYFAGMIRLDPAVAEIRATGVFPLRRPQEALDVLAASLGLSVASVAHCWITIGPRAG